MFYCGADVCRKRPDDEHDMFVGACGRVFAATAIKPSGGCAPKTSLRPQPPATSHNNCEQSTAALFAVFDPFVAGKFRWFDSAVIGKLHRVFIDVHKNIVQRKHGLKVVFRINKLDRADTIRLGVEK